MVLIKTQPDEVVLEAHPTTLHGRATIEREIFQRQYDGVKVGDLSPLWPENRFRRAAIDFAEWFKRDMEKKGFQAITAESDFVIRGPLPHRKWDGLGQKAVGRRLDEDLYPDSADFTISAVFLARGYMKAPIKEAA